MSGRRPAWFAVRELVLAAGSPYKPLERLVGLVIADHIGQSGEAWPSLRRIVERTGMSQTAVRAAIDRLCEGEAAVFERTRGGARPGDRYASTRYCVRKGIASRQAEGVAPRGAQETRGSSGDVEGIAPRVLGYRPATQNVSVERIRERNNVSLSPRDTLDGLVNGLSEATEFEQAVKVRR